MGLWGRIFKKVQDCKVVFNSVVDKLLKTIDYYD